MILPIYAYGQPVLRQKTEELTKDYPEFKQLLENMFETMYNANGVGLAAPQIGKAIRLFLVDTEQIEDEDGEKSETGIKQAFINPKILEETGEIEKFEEGCLSIPDVREDVKRKNTITIEYLDENFKKHKKTFDGFEARVIQHEYDHIEQILFTDYLKPLKKRLIKKRLENISKGKVNAKYKMKFPR